ncbi:alpha/beta fold hydrolase [Marinobacter sp. M216]|uniref:Alpha/beta fold hydrolase n=1 Tax=Marinobacter albus TaxID=3030833 RepID=A0ABT7H7V9_9GAMM|nr:MULTISPECIES: alpha/beta fold hydrolase [unclassified Marinobacter]MBW7471280.1 alpha/beta fold hydrolase [Marinobacter sp. F4218]MDK9556443.1 alpha/beta fold hydrolase [Marinobacter sp. M216]
MTARPIFPMIALLISTLLLSACSRHSLYDNAISWERSGAGLEASSIQVDDMTIAYLSNAEPVDGETIVLIHGFAANKDNWTRLARELTDEFNVYAIDLPGHGDSSKPLDLGYSLEEQTERLAEILQALSIGNTHMMGNSMGGAITALYAASYPGRIKTAVLFDPAGIFEYESELVDLVMEGDNPLIPSKPGDLERLMDFALEQKPFVPWPILDVMEEKAIANRPVNEVIFDAIRDSGYESAFRARLALIRDPVLVVWGKEDRVINYRNGELFVAAIPDARLQLLDDIGHAPMIEAPERSAELFRSFLESAH